MGKVDSCPTDQAIRNCKSSLRRSWFSIIAILVAVELSLAGCAAIKGSPDPVIETDATLKDLNLYLTGDVIAKFYSANNSDRDGSSPRDWRDRVISAQICAADLRFRDYKQKMYSQTVGFNVGLDMAVLGLSGAAAVASQGAANALAAASAGLVGASAVISKNAYYEKTLPALIAAMEANRKRVLVKIRTSQKNDEQQYSLSDALSDLVDYEAAGSIHGAVSQITASATNSAAESEQHIQALFQVAPVAVSVQTRKKAINSYVRDLFKNNDKNNLDLIATALGTPTSANLQDEKNDILLKMDSMVKTNADMDALSAKLKNITQKEF